MTAFNRTAIAAALFLATTAHAQGAIDAKSSSGSDASIRGKVVQVDVGPASAARKQHIYDLTDAQRFDEARAAGKQFVTDAPNSAAAHLVYAYALRHAGDKSAALREYQEVTRLEPGNKDALTGQVLMLNAIGAPILAQELASSNKLALPQATSNAIRHAQAIQLIRLAPVDADLQAERSRKLSQAIAILRELSTTDATKVPDLIAALARNGDHAEALTQYEALAARGEAPQWLLSDAAASYAAIRQYTKAADLFAQAHAVNPDEPEIWSSLFYLYADTSQNSKAQALIDGVRERCEKTKCSAIETALALQVYSRLWGSDTAAAKQLVLAALTARPSSNELKSAYVAVLSASGLKTAAKEQIKALAALSPEVLDFQLSRIAMEDYRSDARAFETELSALEKAFPGNGQVARLRKDWDDSKAGSIQFELRSERDETSSTLKTGVTVTSPTLNDKGLRLVASRTQTAYSLPGADGRLVATEVGVDLPLTFGTQLGARATSTSTGAGYKLNASHQATDDLRVVAQLSKNDGDVPLKALPSGTRMDTLSLSFSYRLTDRQELGGSVQTTVLSDDNRRSSASVSHVLSGAATPDWSYRWANRLGVDSSTNQAVAYFSPSASRWVESEYAISRKFWLSDNNFVTVTPRASIGLVDQTNYSALPFASLGAGLTFKFGANAALELNASVAKKPYDGEYSTQTVFGLLFTWGWY